MEQPLVSIVVVSYNHSKYIRENLDSIKAQTYPNIELIVGDDASKDNSVEVFEQWLSENNYPAKKNFHSKNTGLATMLNECTEMVNGKYVKFIAADDYLHRDYIKSCVTITEKQDSDIVFSQAFSVDDSSKIIDNAYFRIPANPIENIYKKLAYGNFISGSTLFFRKSVIEKIGRYNPEILLEDYDFVLRALSHNCKFSFINQSLIFYRRHSSNITDARFLDLEIETEKLKLKYFKRQDIARIINSSISGKLLKYGKPFSKRIFFDFLKYPFKSKKLLLRLIKNIIS